MRQPLNSQDVHTLHVLLESAATGYPALFEPERLALKRVAAFLERPTPREIDEIVKSQNLVPSETHAVERTVNALWGKR